MSTISRRAWLGIGGLATAAGGLLVLAKPKVSRADTSSRWPNTSPREDIRKRYFPDVLLTTHEGKQVRFYDDLIKDKIVTINFMYAGCEVTCPLTTANLVRIQKILGDRVGRDLFMYSITLDPKHDVPQVLKKYANTHGVGPGWTFLTGKPGDIELLRRKLGFTDPNPVRDADKENHIGNIRYGNEPLMLWAAMPGTGSAEFLAESILSVIRPETGSVILGRGKR